MSHEHEHVHMHVTCACAACACACHVHVQHVHVRAYLLGEAARRAAHGTDEHVGLEVVYDGLACGRGGEGG